MKKSILIEDKPFYFESEELTDENAPIITFEQAQAILFKAKELLESKNIKFGLIFGTLLGAIREHSFISHDYDVDIYIDDLSQLLKYIPEFDEQGFKLCRVENNRLYSFRYNGAYIDMYVLRKAPFPFNLYCYFVGSDIIPKRYFDKTQCINFLGKEFLIAKEAEKFMEFCYGKSWRTPVKGYGGRCSVYPVYFWRKYIRKYFTK